MLLDCDTGPDNWDGDTLGVVFLTSLQHCDTLTTCSSLLKECLLSPTDGIMSKDASSASHCDHVSRAPSENIIQNIQCWTQKDSYISWILREMSFGLFSGANCLWKPKCWRSKFAANYPGRHLHISTRISHILHSLTGIFGHQPTIDERVYTRLVTITKLKIFKHIKMSPEHRNRERFNRLWVISMCFYWMLSISSISFKATIKSSFAFVSDWRISWNILLMP